MKSLLITAFIMLLSITAFIFVACSSDEEKSSDDRAKFVGTYMGTIECKDILKLLNNDSLQFTVSKDPGSTDGISISVQTSIPINFNAKIQGSNIIIDNKINSIFPLPTGGVITNGEVAFSGKGTLSADQKRIIADVAIKVKDLTTNIVLVENNSCTLGGTKL